MQDDRIGPNPGGLCMCGCGGPAPIAAKTWARKGTIKGLPQRFIHGHNSYGHRQAVQYVEEDRGYQTPCWIWQLALNPAGYGMYSRMDVRTRLAHKALWEREHGPVPDGLQLDHLCCQTSCVRPDHLEAVTPAINSRRSRRAKLNVQQVAQIRALCEGGRWKNTEIAWAYGVDARTISEIRYRHSWKNVA